MRVCSRHFTKRNYFFPGRKKFMYVIYISHREKIIFTFSVCGSGVNTCPHVIICSALKTCTPLKLRFKESLSTHLPYKFHSLSQSYFDLFYILTTETNFSIPLNVTGNFSSAIFDHLTFRSRPHVRSQNIKRNKGRVR